MSRPRPLSTRGGIARRVVTLLFAFGILPMGLLTLVFLVFYLHGQKEGITRVQREIAQRIAAAINDRLEHTSSQVRLLAGLIDLQQAGRAVLQQSVDLLLEREAHFDSITLADPDGTETFKASRYYSYRPFEMQNIADLSFFRSAVAGKVGIGPVEISPPSSFPKVRVSAPVIDASERLTGVLVADVTIAHLWQLVAKQSIGESRYAYIVDNQGVLIAYQDLSSVLQGRELHTLESVVQFLSGRTGVFEYRGLEGTAVIGASAGVALTGWAVIVEEPLEAAYGGLYTLGLTLGALLLLSITLAVLLGLRFSYRYVIRPIRLLQHETDTVAQGDLAHAIAPSGGGELGQLAESFNAMVAVLRRTTVSRDRLMREIEERTLAEERLQASESALRSILRAAPIGIGLVNQRMIHWVNDRVSEMTGIPGEELLGRSARILYPSEEEFERVGREKYLQIAQGGTGTVETVWQHRDGSTIVVLLSSTALDPEDLNAGVTFTALDITERKRMESQLHQVQKMEAVGTLAGGIAHDFNNILAAIIGFTELALDDLPAAASLAGNLREVLTAAYRARDLVQQILTFSRQTEQTLGPIQVCPIVREVLQLLRASLPSTITIRTNLASGALILGDATQIHQILMNLGINAGHAMRQTGGELAVTLSDVAITSESPRPGLGLAPGDYLHLSVSDTGHGMSAEVRERIFDPFFTTKGPGEGTGMGLSVVHGIMRNYGGAIQVESQPDKGSVFRLYFPALPPMVTPDRETLPAIPGGNERILLVDDEPALLTMGQRLLASLGYRVTVCEGPLEALALFEREPQAIDLLVTDMTMPGMTGDILAAAVMALRPELPVILCTGFSGLIDAQEAAQKGIRGFIAKPFRRHELALVVREALDAAPSDAPPRWYARS